MHHCSGLCGAWRRSVGRWPHAAAAAAAKGRAADCGAGALLGRRARPAAGGAREAAPAAAAMPTAGVEHPAGYQYRTGAQATHAALQPALVP